MKPPSQPFPPRQPASLTDSAEIIRNDWEAFSTLDMLTNHWDRPAWPDGAAAYYWLLPLGHLTDLQVQTRACQEALSGVPDLDPVPTDLLHLTIHRVAAGDITIERLTDISSEAASRLAATQPIPLVIGPLAGSTGAIRFSVTPWHRLTALHNELVATTRSGGSPSPAWRPHVSIAYNARPRIATPIIHQVRELRRQPPTAATVTEIELVRLTRAGRMYRWSTVHRLSLNGSAE